MKRTKLNTLALIVVALLGAASCSNFFTPNATPAGEEGSLLVQMPETASWVDRLLAGQASATRAKGFGVSRAFVVATVLKFSVTDSSGVVKAEWEQTANVFSQNTAAGYASAVPLDKKTLPVGNYTLKVDVFNAANSTSVPVVSGNTPITIAKGITLKTAVTCLPVNPTNFESGGLSFVPGSPWNTSVNPVIKGGETWLKFEVPSGQAYSNLVIAPETDSTAKASFGVFNAAGECIASATADSTTRIAKAGFDSSAGIYYAGVIDSGVTSANRKLSATVTAATAPKDRITSFKLSMGTADFPGSIDNAVGTIKITSLFPGVDLKQLLATYTVEEGATVAIENGPSLVGAARVLNFSKDGNVVYLSVSPSGTSLPTRRYAVMVTDPDPLDPFAAIAFNKALDAWSTSINSPYHAASVLDSSIANIKVAKSMAPESAKIALFDSMATLASIAANPDLQTLAKDRLGVLDYPSTTTDFVMMFTGRAAFGIGMQVQMGGSIANLPKIEIPANIKTWEDSATTITFNEWILGLVYNVATKNPEGFNALADDVVDKVLGSRLSAAVAALKAIPDEAGFGLPSEWTGASVAFPDNSATYKVPFVIGKAEILALASGLEALRATILMAKSLSLGLPLQQYWNALNPIDHAALYSGSSADALLSALFSQSTPFKAPNNFLMARPEAATVLSGAKTAYASSLNTLTQAIDLMVARNTKAFALSSDSSMPYMTVDSWRQFSDILKVSRILATKVKTSMTGGSVAILPIPDSSNTAFQRTDGSLDMNLWTAHFAVESNWPTVADWGVIPSGSDLGHQPTAIAVKFGAFFDKPLIALDSLFAIDGATGEPELYKVTVTMVTGSFDNISVRQTAKTTSMTDAEATALNTLYAIKIKDLTLGGLVTIDASAFAQLRDKLIEQFSSLTGSAIPSANIPGIVDKLIVFDSTTGRLSVYLPVVPPHIAYNAFATAGETPALTIEYWKQFSSSATSVPVYTTRGSFWWGLYDYLALIQSPVASVQP